MCGEQSFCIPNADAGIGITPACAGNSMHAILHGKGVEDHPRVCGEQICGWCISFQEIGSPPRVRGTGAVQTAMFYSYRITPACAGNRERYYGKGIEKDHPRVCGEQPEEPIHHQIWDHPRVCGEQLAAYEGQFRQLGITPACAGNRWVWKYWEIKK